MTLRSRLLSSDTRVVAASENRPAFFSGEANAGVRTLQIGLIKIGYAMPISQPAGKTLPDGVYGDETVSIVSKFQTAQGLDVDGIAGHDTIHALDALLANEHRPPKRGGQSPPPGGGQPGGGAPGAGPPGAQPGPGDNPDFKIGTDDPKKHGDAGAGKWNSHWKTPDMIAFKSIMTTPHFQACAVAGIGDDAAKHLCNYLANFGWELTIDLEGMMRETDSCRLKYVEIVKGMKAYVETLQPGVWNVTSRRSWTGYATREDDRNWYFAVGGHQTWGKCVARVQENGDCFMAFEYKFRDRYNWDSGKSVTIGGVRIRDSLMGELHLQGLACEYDMVGSLRRSFSWAKGRHIPLDQYDYY